jgi:hypothetical protein
MITDRNRVVDQLLIGNGHPSTILKTDAKGKKMAYLLNELDNPIEKNCSLGYLNIILKLKSFDNYAATFRTQSPSSKLGSKGQLQHLLLYNGRKALTKEIYMSLTNPVGLFSCSSAYRKI